MTTLRNATPELSDWNSISGRDDPQQRFRIYRLCDCAGCDGEGKVRDLGAKLVAVLRCPDCRGEGKVRELVATAGSPEGVGAAIIALGREGEFEECPIGILDTEGEVGQKWIIRPWLPSRRNVTDAARLLGSQPKGRKA